MVNFRISWSGWQNILNLSPQSFICGFCGDKIGTTHGYHNSHNGAFIYICTNCGAPTFIYQGNQYPGPLLGRNIEKLPQDISTVYSEIRESIKNANYTAAALLGRKLIMHLAVDVARAQEGDTFVNYINHLKSAGYVPPNGERWIEKVRELGNEKNHELKIGTQEEAARLLKFIEILLIFIYEFSEDAEPDENAQTP